MSLGCTAWFSVHHLGRWPPLTGSRLHILTEWCGAAFLVEEWAALARLRPPDERLMLGKACFREAGEQPVKETAHPRAGDASRNPNLAKETPNSTDEF